MAFQNHADTIIGGGMMLETGERISVKVEKPDDDWRADDSVGTSRVVEVKREPGVERKRAGRKKFKCKATPMKCEHCDYSCKSKRTLTYHIMVKHSAMEPWRCDHPDCQFTTREKGTMKRHKINIHESKKPFKCEECPLAFKNKSNLKRHSCVHTGNKPFKCPKCRYSSLEKRLLHSHEQRKHVNEKKHKCDECGDSYNSKDDLEKHKLNHNDAAKKFKCHLCPYRTLKKAELRSHSHSHSNKGRFKCDECDRSFYSMTDLKSHRFTHSKIESFLCDECDYRTNNPINLRRHRLVCLHSVSKGSSGEKCVHCGLTLRDQSDSTTHRDAHRPCSVPLPRVTDSRDVIAPPILRRVKIELNDDVVIKTENV